jgi:hypothetical protein
MKTEGLLPCSHEAGIKTYPELKESDERFRTPKPSIDDILYTIKKGKTIPVTGHEGP